MRLPDPSREKVQMFCVVTEWEVKLHHNYESCTSARPRIGLKIRFGLMASFFKVQGGNLYICMQRAVWGLLRLIRPFCCKRN